MKNLWLCILLAGCGSNSSFGGDDAGDDTVDAGDIVEDSGVGVGVDAPPDAMVCTANVQVDPNNCGVCGRSCLGGSCSAGMCQTTRLDGGNMTNFGDVYVDNLFVYFTAFTSGTNPHRLWRMPLGGTGTANHLTVLTTPATLSQVAFVDPNFYVVEPNRFDTLDRGNIRRIGKEPFSGSTILDFQPPTTTAIMVHNGFIYWATDTDGANGGDIKRVPIAGGMASTVTVGAGFVEYMKTDGTNIFFVGGGQLKKAPLSVGATTIIGTANSKTIDLDSTRVYAVSGSEIVYAQLGGNNTIPLSANGAQNITAGVAIGSKYVYAAKEGNKLVAISKDDAMHVQMWTEPSIDIGNGCFLKYKITRIKEIGDYCYFSAQVVNSCGNVVSSEGLYRTPRM